MKLERGMPKGTAGIRKIDQSTWQLTEIANGSALAVSAINTELVCYSLLQQGILNWVWDGCRWDYGCKPGAGAVVAAPAGFEMDDN